MAEQGLAESREQAQVLIMEGLVFTRAGRGLKASSLLQPGDLLLIDIHTDNVIAGFSEASPRHQADITCSNNADFHGSRINT